MYKLNLKFVLFHFVMFRFEPSGVRTLLWTEILMEAWHQTNDDQYISAIPDISALGNKRT